MLRLLIIPTVLLALLAGAMVWSGGGATRPADFTYICGVENKTLDLGVMSWMQDIRVAYALWEGLYTLDPVTLEPVYGCADHVDLSPDRKVYTFHIRDAAQWSNGDPLTASDFVFAWGRMMEQPGEYTYLLDYIKGAGPYRDDYVKWRARVAEWGKAHRAGDGTAPPAAPPFTVGVEALSKSVLRVTLENPVPYFPALCAYVPLYPQHEGCMRKFGQWDDTHSYIASYDQQFTRPPNLVSNGPYRLQEWSFKLRVRLVANEHYWNRAAVKSHVVDQVYASDGLAAYRLYESGADWVTDVDPSLVPELQQKGRQDLKVFKAFGTFWYEFNCQPTLPGGKPNPFTDRRVRRALGMAINKEPIVRNATRAGEVVARDYVPIGVFPLYHSPSGLPYDPAQARKELADAGYPNGQGFPRVTLMFSSDSPAMAATAQIVHRQWQQELGIDVELQGLEVTVFGARLHSHDFAISAGDWYGDYDDISTFTDLFRSTSENNNPDWRSPEYDALLDKAALEPNPQKRLDLLSQAENLMLEDAPIAPLYYGVGRYLIHDRVHGIPLDARQSVMLNAVQVDRR